MPGVVAFVGPEDIPGENKVGLGGMDAQIFASGKTEYLHQTLGLIVAESPSLAEKAAKLVEVAYSHPKVCLQFTARHHVKNCSRSAAYLAPIFQHQASPAEDMGLFKLYAY